MRLAAGFRTRGYGMGVQVQVNENSPADTL